MLYLMPIYFIIALILIIKLMKKYPAKHRIAQFLLLSFLFYLPVGWDVMLGRAYFNYLCHKDGGIHIYQTVELGPAYWNKDGSPKFYTEKGDFDESFFDDVYKVEISNDRYINKRPFRIVRYVDKVIDKKTNSILGEWIMYEYLGGWVIHTWQPFIVGSIVCHFYDATPDNPAVDMSSLVSRAGIINSHYSKFTSYIFLRKDTENKQGEKQ